ncbi:MAG: tRNA (N6-threonylcarbamoyladenosine(37)-N6)-methyltransferase TrmO [Desulfobacteraceae bacterium]|nr:tRNA (N6-threonylcarbamoyladenosine(37)-N6)-methyltransferase TrmO [Desulfobacteraceae bacterium]
MAVRFEPIGILHTCYKEKFGIPRQPNLVADAPARLVFTPEFAREEAVRGLEEFSHVWLIFLFHETRAKNGSWSPMVRPPRLGGNKKVGVFATRSPFRPNPMGMSAVRLESVEICDKGPVLHLSGVDILDQTPILDIKPYLPYSDIIPDARNGFAPAPPRTGLEVQFSEPAMARIREKEKTIPNLLSIITGILENDPRPAYRSGRKSDPESGRISGIRLFDFDLKWTVEKDVIRVLDLEDQEPPLI